MRLYIVSLNISSQIEYHQRLNISSENSLVKNYNASTRFPNSFQEQGNSMESPLEIESPGKSELQHWKKQ